MNSKHPSIDSDLRQLLMFAPLDGPQYRLRMVKFCLVAKKLGIDVQYFGWNRGFDQTLWEGEPLAKSNTPILSGETKSSLAKKIGYLRWCYATWRQLWRLKPKSIVYCLGFETAFAAYCYSFFFPIRFIFDDADTFSLHAPLPSFLKPFVRLLENWTRQKSRLTIVPTAQRYDRMTETMRLIKNTPDRSLVDISRSLEVSRPVNAKLIVYANGVLTDYRGLGILQSVATRLGKNPDTAESVLFLLAGRMEDPDHEILTLPNVDYKGRVPNTVALSYYRIADLVFTYYDPAGGEINRYASSNKWGDCLVFGVPPLINREVESVPEFREQDACLTFDYEDVDGLTDCIQQIVRQPELLDQLKNNLRPLQESFQYFDDAITSEFHQLYPDSSGASP